MTPLVILGGTFDPVHVGHLRIAWEASEVLHAPVHLLPVNQPPHRKPPYASASARANILRIALQGQQRLMLDLSEIERGGPSYTVDTLEALRQTHPSRSLILLMGTDAFLGLPKWHHWQRLWALAHIAVLKRPGYVYSPEGELAREVDSRKVDAPQRLHQTTHGLFMEIAVTPIDVSASHVRKLLAQDREPRFLLPDQVFADPATLAPYRKR